MKRLSLALAAMGLGFAAVASATSPHFLNVSSELSGSRVRVCFKESGLEANQSVNLVATANAVATYGCVNRAGICVSGIRSVTVEEAVSGSAAFDAGVNGSLTQCVTIPPPSAPAGYSCPNGLTLTLLNVTYTNIRITDTGFGNSDTASPSTQSASFVTCR